MAKFLKGQDVKLKVKGSGSTYNSLLEKETSCSLSFNVNTIDAANKSDEDPEYEHAEFENTELSAQVSGNVKDVAEIRTLLAAALGTDNTYCVEAVLSTDSEGEPKITTIVIGSVYGACMTSLEIDMPADGLATVSASLECGSDFNIA